MVTSGPENTFNAVTVLATHPVELLTKVNVVLPVERAVTIPAFVTEAIVGSLLVQIPSEVGDSVVVVPMHMLVLPVKETIGGGSIITSVVGFDVQVLFPINVKVAVPGAWAVTIPELVTEAMFSSLLDHVPPVEGNSVVVSPMQILSSPDTEASIGSFTMTC